jgi:hypothetical protein
VTAVSQAHTERNLDPERLYERVVTLLRAWDPDDRGFGLDRSLQRHLRRHLHDEFPERLPRVETDTGIQAYDVVVDGTVAVVVYREFGSDAVSEFRRTVQADRTRCEYLVVYALDLPEKDLGRWRMGKLRYTAERSGFDAITYLRHADAAPDEGSEWPSVLWRYAEPIVALLAIVIGLEVAVLLNLQFGAVEPLMGPLATAVTVLVLAGLLVLIYEQTEI